MSDAPVSLTPSGPPETVLDPPEPQPARALQEAMAEDADRRRDAVAAVVARWPRYLDAWAHLGECEGDDVARYAAFRVGYHRGLDQLRASGWRGSGYVRWRHDSNRGFLRALRGLRDTAGALGERDEQERCALFLTQLDPEEFPGVGAPPQP